MKFVRNVNDDNGSLNCGEYRLAEGDLIEIEGEARTRRVTYVMGSTRKGWRACFRGQGAVPVGEIAWRKIEVANAEKRSGAAADASAERIALVSPHRRLGADENSVHSPVQPESAPQVNLLTRLRESTSQGLPGLSDGLAVFGFDSAWTRQNRGAISGVRYDAGKVTCLMPRNVGFGEALDAISEFSKGSSTLLVGIDQPLIVKNQAGRRAVEATVSHVIGRRGGGVQPANRSRTGMFCDDAPIWEFLKLLGPDIDPLNALVSRRGVHAIEVYPAAANIVLFQDAAIVEPLLKYNPTRKKTFRLTDWQELCDRVAHDVRSAQMLELANWCARAAANPAPRKADQDILDSIICLLVAVRWRERGMAESLVLGDMESGYMVIPTNAILSAEFAALMR
jgi:predicted RNase H-like nuclease